MRAFETPKMVHTLRSMKTIGNVNVIVDLLYVHHEEENNTFALSDLMYL